jgi:putative ABC transport system permease protein
MKKKQIQPPGLANALFSWYCRNASIEDLEGDLEEIFYSDIKVKPLWKAQLHYWGMVISLIFSYSIKKRKREAAHHPFASTNGMDLFVNYFKVSSRSLARNRFFTIINVAGLAVGMSISLLFISMITYVSHYDTFHENRDRIFRVTTRTEDQSHVWDFASSPVPIGEKIKVELSGIDEVVRISKSLSGTAVTDKKEIPLNGYFADEGFFHLFTFPMVNGNPQTVLQKPMSIVLTESAAKKAFGEEDAFGKTLVIEPWGNFEITGIMKDHPKPSHLYFEVIASYNSLPPVQQNSRGWSDFRNHYTYVLFSESLSVADFQTYLQRISKETPTYEGTKYSYGVQSLNDIAPGREYYNEIGPEWSYASFMIFGFLTLLILLPACSNYANISISRTLKRAREIGLRKTVGGQRNQIFTQFITETVLITLIALAGAFLMFTQIRGQFLAMLVSAEGLELSADFETIIYFILFAVFTGFMAGVIPAAYFSKLNPVQALKNVGSLKSNRKFSLQKILVVGQFALSLGFIMAVVIVLKQYRETLNYNFGFEQTNILDVELQGADPARFRNEFSRLASIKNLSMSSGIMGTYLPGEVTVFPPENPMDSLVVSQIFADENYIQNLGIRLLAGNTFPARDQNASERFIIVNEEFLKSYKIPSPADAINMTFIVDDSVEVLITGVVKNFHYNNLREPIRSFIFRNDPSKFQYANLAVSSNDMYRSIEEMESVWTTLDTNEKFRSRFFADEITDTYSFYFSMIKICGFLGFLAITISCLGLLGMVVFTTENRMKELGIRKVMGATSWQLAMLLSKGYLKLMLIAAFIAVPVTYFLFDRFMLDIQHYRFEIGGAEIVISLLIMLILGGGTIFSQTVKASGSNPVDTLKTE